REDLEVVVHAVLIAIVLARIRDAVAVLVREHAAGDIEVVRNAVPVAIGLAGVENRVRVPVRLLRELAGVGDSVAVAISLRGFARRAEEDRDSSALLVRDQEIRAPVSVEIRDLHSDRRASYAENDRLIESAMAARTEKDRATRVLARRLIEDREIV